MNNQNIVPGYQYQRLNLNEPSEEVVQGQNMQFNVYQFNSQNGQVSQDQYKFDQQQQNQPLQGLTLEQYEQLKSQQYFNNQQSINNQTGQGVTDNNQQLLSDSKVQQLQNKDNQNQNLNKGSTYPTFGESQLREQQNDSNNDDKSQQNMDKNNNNSKESDVKLYYDSVRNCNYIIHQVLPSDTLIGLSIRYNASEHKIKIFNDLDSDEIWFKKTLKIPNPQTNVIGDSNQDIDEVIKQQQISEFKFHVLDEKDKSDKMAKFYLEDNDYDLKMATKAYRDDIQWEMQQKKQAEQQQSLKYKKMK